MPGLLYPAYQKFYSAISSLKRFDKEKSFFDNIASLDTFFSEYRSITLVMQESLAHTPYLDTYQRVSKGIWDPFFNTQRVKTIHIHPMEFTKQIDITVYFPSEGINVTSQIFTIENDIPLGSLIESLKEFLHKINPSEVFFSAKFSFIEKDSGQDLWDKLISGIATMQKFMDAMYVEIGEDCALCNRLKNEINKSGYALLPKDFFLINDYAYYPREDKFERAGRMAMVMLGMGGKAISRHPLISFMESPHLNFDNTPFGKFMLMHVIIQNTNIMPTLMIVYQDGTYNLDAFHADIKTTVYRKINEVAECILSDNIKEVYFMNAYVYYKYSKRLLRATSKQRIKKAVSDCLAFMRVDYEMNENEYVFNGQHIRNMKYIANQMQFGKQNKLGIGSVNMKPIVDAFKEKRSTAGSPEGD